LFMVCRLWLLPRIGKRYNTHHANILKVFCPGELLIYSDFPN
jgi:hypothetical protein